MTKMVYKCPGNPRRPDHIVIGDDVIDYKIVSDEDFDGALGEGWAASPEEARSDNVPEASIDVDGNGRVTKKEIAAKLKELGIDFDSRASKAELEEVLVEALSE